MYVSVDQDSFKVQMSPNEREILLGFYSGLPALAVALQTPIQEWVNARIKLKQEADMRNFAQQFALLPSDKQAQVMRILNGN